MTFLPLLIAPLRRVLLVALLTPALLLALTATVPALAVLPFLTDGTERAVRLLWAHNAYLRTLLATSPPTP
ncbi:dTMP kinase [Streptomyces parvulus]|uniref:dTMP kinase n=1 Tax=Streptomyces parvulus TaxID=146923 RepID=UPI0033D4BDE7